MNDLVLIFVSQFFLIFLMGLQGLNVKDGHTILAGIVSALLSLCGFYVTGLTAKAFDAGFISWFGVSFTLAGTLGIMCAMKTHKYIVRFYGFLKDFPKIW